MSNKSTGNLNSRNPSGSSKPSFFTKRTHEEVQEGSIGKVGTESQKPLLTVKTSEDSKRFLLENIKRKQEESLKGTPYRETEERPLRHKDRTPVYLFSPYPADKLRAITKLSLLLILLPLIVSAFFMSLSFADYVKDVFETNTEKVLVDSSDTDTEDSSSEDEDTEDSEDTDSF